MAEAGATPHKVSKAPPLHRESYSHVKDEEKLLPTCVHSHVANSTRYFTDGWGAYERHVEAERHTVGKAYTQKIESKHINLRTRIKRLVRRTICFSKTVHIHDLVIGLFINRYELGVSV